jgi:predicted RNase H-like HicB family nuclease
MILSLLDIKTNFYKFVFFGGQIVSKPFFSLNIGIGEQSGSYMITSPEIKGLLVSGKTLEKALEYVVFAMKDMHAAQQDPDSKKNEVLEQIFSESDKS